MLRPATVLLGLVLLAPPAVRAACDLPVLPTATPPDSSCVLGPPGVCSGHTGIACDDDCDCPDNARGCPSPARSCPDGKERCIHWPFVDRDADGCFDAGDTPLELPAVWDQCERARTGAAPADAGDQPCRRDAAGTITCCSADTPACCTFDGRVAASPRFRVQLGASAAHPVADYGVTAPADLKCFSNWLRGENVLLQVQSEKAFRNYAWGAWKDHHQRTRLMVLAPSIVLGGLADPRAELATETHYNYDKDVVLLATGGCMLGGTVTDGIGPNNEIQMNKGGAGNTILLSAPGKLSLPAGKWSVKGGKGAATVVAGCPLCLDPRDLPADTAYLECQPRCVRTAFPFDLQRYCLVAAGWTDVACLADAGCGGLGAGARCMPRTCRTGVDADCPAAGDACRPTQPPADACP
jgi:hypothetical protein